MCLNVYLVRNSRFLAVQSCYEMVFQDLHAQDTLI